MKAGLLSLTYPNAREKLHIDTPEETIKYMRGLPERIAKFKEKLRELRETDTR